MSFGHSAFGEIAFSAEPAQEWFAARNLRYRDFACFMRFTGSNYGSTEAYRESAWHDPLIVDIPSQNESLRDEFGIQSGETLEVTVADTAIRSTLEAGTLDGAEVVLEWVTTSYYTFGSPVEDVLKRTYNVKGYKYRPGLVTLNLVDIEDARLSAVYPPNIFTVANWSELFVDHVGRAVPVAVGTAIKVPCALIQTNSGAGPWVFAVSQVIGGTPDTVLTVYRNGRVVDSGEYTVGTATSGEYTVRTLSFAAEQIDFNGNLYEISADLTANNSSNAVTELNRILTAAGVTPDSTTFAAGVTYATTNVMRADYAYTEQREYRSIVYDLLQVCRASLVRNDVGDYELVQDTEQSVTYTYNESYGDLISVTEYESAEPPALFTLAYRPNPADLSKLQYLVSRNAYGVSGTEHLDTEIVRDHTCADRLIDYLAKRRRYGAKAKASVYIDAIELGQVVSLTSDTMWSGAKSWKVIGIQRRPACNDLDLQQYSANVYDYAAGTLPDDPTNDYSPDYSQTPPATPTSVTVVSGGVALNQDGVAQSYVLVKSTPPTVNWKEIWFLVTNTVTNEIYIGLGTDNGDGTYGTRIAGLRPNVAHTLVSWAVNAFNVKGIVSSAVNFTSTAWTSAPSAPTSVSAAQGTGKIVRVTWTNPAITNLREVQVHRKIGAGAYSQVAAVKGTSYDDTNVSYGSQYTYKTIAVDLAGNLSADSGTAAITPQVNVDSPDLVNASVTTPKRQAMNTQSMVLTDIPAGAPGYTSFTHSLETSPTCIFYSSHQYVVVWGSTLIGPLTVYAPFGYYNTYTSEVTATIRVDYW